MNMYVANLAFNVQEEDLKTLFGTCGEVVSAKIITNRDTGESRGFGFVQMKTNEDGKRALESLNHKELLGRNITVSEAREKESKPQQRNRW